MTNDHAIKLEKTGGAYMYSYYLPIYEFGAWSVME
jgi:hypothetical protein